MLSGPLAAIHIHALSVTAFLTPTPKQTKKSNNMKKARNKIMIVKKIINKKIQMLCVSPECIVLYKLSMGKKETYWQLNKYFHNCNCELLLK